MRDNDFGKVVISTVIRDHKKQSMKKKDSIRKFNLYKIVFITYSPQGRVTLRFIILIFSKWPND